MRRYHICPGLVMTVALGLAACGGSNDAGPSQSIPPMPVSDTSPPILSNLGPSGTQASGTKSVTLSVNTNENATCRYSKVAGQNYSAMTEVFETTGSTEHSEALNELSDGSSYSYYVRCQDPSGNTNANDGAVNFSVKAHGKTTVSWNAPTLRANGSSLTDLAGFTLYRGNNDVSYQDVIIIEDPDVRSYDFEKLDAGTHYFTVTAYDSQGRESARPSPVSKTIN